MRRLLLCSGLHGNPESPRRLRRLVASRRPDGVLFARCGEAVPGRHGLRWALGYDTQEMDALPAPAPESFCGVSNPRPVRPC